MTWGDVVGEIERDSRSGATALSRRAAEALRLAADELPSAGPDWRGTLREAALAVAMVRPPFAGLARLASAVLDGAEGTGSAAEASTRVRLVIDDAMGRLDEDAGRIVAEAGRLLAAPGRSCRTVLTISASSLVERAVLAASRETSVEVICLESRPLLEGAALARRLAAAGCPVSLAVDAAGPALAARADLVLLGGDTLAPNGLVHKLGTFGVALAARQAGVSVYALVGGEKLLPALVRGALADGGAPAEVLGGVEPGGARWADQLAGLTVLNRYFDLTPLDLLTGVVLPDGVVGPDEVARRAAAVAVHPALRHLLSWRQRGPGSRPVSGGLDPETEAVSRGG